MSSENAPPNVEAVVVIPDAGAAATAQLEGAAVKRAVVSQM